MFLLRLACFLPVLALTVLTGCSQKAEEQQEDLQKVKDAVESRLPLAAIEETFGPGGLMQGEALFRWVDDLSRGPKKRDNLRRAEANPRAMVLSTPHSTIFILFDEDWVAADVVTTSH